MPDPTRLSLDPAALLTGADSAAVPLAVIAPDAYDAWRATAADSQRASANARGFEAKPGDVLLFDGADGRPASGLAISAERRADSYGFIAAWAKIAESLPAGAYRLDPAPGGEDMALLGLGWLNAQYKFSRYLSEDKRPPARRLIVPDEALRREIHRQAAAVTLVRDLVNTPANDMLPDALEEAARRLADRYGADISVTSGEALLHEGFPAIHAVGRASATPPRLIDLRWGDPGAEKLTLVGKGVCFDSGGLDIKAAGGMRLMKKDMGGAAHALGLAQMIMDAGLKLRLRVLIPAVENAIAGNAFRPGDIIATRKGRFVEIGNTDAEGRLVLADALAFADEEAPGLLLDFATLTGAARVALGADLPALFTADDALAADFAKAGAHEGDPLWRLPLWRPYREDLASPIADIANANDGGFAGAITAALFLESFVEQAGLWAHFDLYAWNKSNRPGRPAGGEAMTIRAAFRLIRDRISGA